MNKQVDTNQPIILETIALTKTFNNGAIVANNKVSIAFNHSSVHGIVGENGAGKTTFISMLMGLVQPSSGEIKIDNKVTTIKDAAFANSHKIALVPQHIELIDDVTVWENIIVGYEPSGKIFIKRKEAIDRVSELIKKYNFNLRAEDKIKKLSLAQKQQIMILKTLFIDAKIIILDEPTSVLSTFEIQSLIASIKELRKAGKTIIFISHKLEEVLDVCDKISVLRRGTLITTAARQDIDKEKLVDMIIGQKNASFALRKPTKPSEEVLLDVKYMSTFSTRNVRLENINFQIHKGEILGIIGVDGNGQEEIIKTIFRRKKKIGNSTKVLINNNLITTLSTQKILAKHISLIAEDRHADGLVLSESIFKNFFISNIEAFCNKWGILQIKKQKTFVNQAIKQYDIRGITNPKNPVSSLSGGNQQKIIFAREMSKGNKLLIAHKPTTGVDIGAIKTIYENMASYVEKGNGVLLISDEMEEVLQVSHRVMVIYSGKIMGIVSPKTSIKILGKMMLGETYADIMKAS